MCCYLLPHFQTSLWSSSPPPDSAPFFFFFFCLITFSSSSHVLKTLSSRQAGEGLQNRNHPSSPIFLPGALQGNFIVSGNKSTRGSSKRESIHIRISNPFPPPSPNSLHNHIVPVLLNWKDFSEWSKAWNDKTPKAPLPITTPDRAKWPLSCLWYPRPALGSKLPLTPRISFLLSKRPSFFSAQNSGRSTSTSLVRPLPLSLTSKVLSTYMGPHIWTQLNTRLYWKLSARKYFMGATLGAVPHPSFSQDMWASKKPCWLQGWLAFAGRKPGSSHAGPSAAC